MDITIQRILRVRSSKICTLHYAPHFSEQAVDSRAWWLRLGCQHRTPDRTRHNPCIITGFTMLQGFVENARHVLGRGGQAGQLAAGVLHLCNSVYCIRSLPPDSSPVAGSKPN